jgi:GNAT superfamily N-acetyltransferase
VTAAFSICAANASDLPAINTLMHASRAYRGEYYKIIENYFVTPDYLAKNKVFLVERNGALLGFYSLVVDGIADLDLMFVSDDVQGSGVGRALFDHMKTTARQSGYDAVQIGAHPPAVGFYERMGAVRCGVSPPIHGVTWERPLLKLAIAET